METHFHKLASAGLHWLYPITCMSQSRIALTRPSSTVAAVAFSSAVEEPTWLMWSLPSHKLITSGGCLGASGAFFLLAVLARLAGQLFASGLDVELDLLAALARSRGVIPWFASFLVIIQAIFLCASTGSPLVAFPPVAFWRVVFPRTNSRSAIFEDDSRGWIEFKTVLAFANANARPAHKLVFINLLSHL